ncbi:S9 family peptidase [Sulfobacillus sp. hq2]|uniref:S9 family peptidase n=1 Tax=Sulfobacillus TaxID=28033 RepID=UPI000CD1E375|nr:S9 family peptidase [Sulfobacillus sp. hq2]MCY0909341.1 S9 family peptidase [Sulfobacillus thermotolerans]POB11308.1 oligopeptidase B [Sulfobacillus sp. hq2]
MIPRAEKIPYLHILHGDVREDNYYWLKDRNNPEVIRYLDDENRYFEETMQPLRSLTDALYQEMLAYVPEDDEEVAAAQPPYYYYRRTAKGQQYPIYARKAAHHRKDLSTAHEQVLLDINVHAAGQTFYHVSLIRLSPDQQWLAYLENRDGTDRYTLRIKHIDTETYLPETIPNVFLSQSVEWDATNTYLFYTLVDASQRPYRLMRHQRGTDPAMDSLIYEEQDTTFSLALKKTRDGRFLLLTSQNKETSEVRWLDANHPLEPWTVFTPRRTGLLYSMEHWHHQFVVLTNDGAPNFAVKVCEDESAGWDSLRDLVPVDPTVYLQDVVPFAHALILEGRQEGLSQIWIYYQDQRLEKLKWPENLYHVALGPNRSYETDEVLIDYESFLTPKTTLGFNLTTQTRTVLHKQVGGRPFESHHYEQKRLWAPAIDGTSIPLSVVYRVDALSQGPAPLILYGYGSYGVSVDPHFDPAQIPLLDRGIVLVTAHVRGGAELGRAWYEQGKLQHKRNTFTDFIDAARYLIKEGYTTPQKLAARGRSAGGLLMGAVANMAPDLFQVIVPGVPFVDVLTTMLDASIPLTTLEWDEWGNPAHVEDYWYMKSYSPYDNITAQDYPHMMLFTGLNDPRVGYWEPAKFVAKLREVKTDTHTLVLRTAMGAGHAGASGRYQRFAELAQEFAFILDKIAPNQ